MTTTTVTDQAHTDLLDIAADYARRAFPGVEVEPFILGDHLPTPASLPHVRVHVRAKGDEMTGYVTGQAHVIVYTAEGEEDLGTPWRPLLKNGHNSWLAPTRVPSGNIVSGELLPGGRAVFSGIAARTYRLNLTVLPTLPTIAPSPGPSAGKDIALAVASAAKSGTGLKISGSGTNVTSSEGDGVRTTTATVRMTPTPLADPRQGDLPSLAAVRGGIETAVGVGVSGVGRVVRVVHAGYDNGFSSAVVTLRSRTA